MAKSTLRADSSCFFPHITKTNNTRFIKTSLQRRFRFSPSNLTLRLRVVSSTQQDVKESHGRVSKPTLPKAPVSGSDNLSEDVVNWPPWKNLPQRYNLIGTTSLAFVICNMDKVVTSFFCFYFLILYYNPRIKN